MIPAHIPFAAVLALWLAADVAAGNVFGEDRREQRDPRRPILRSVGMLVDRGGGGGGTAFLVSRCHIVTAHHVAYPPGTGGRATEFLIGPDPRIPRRFRSSTRAVVVESGDFSSHDFRGMAGDWAIMRLDDCLGAKFGFLRYSRSHDGDPLPRRELMTIGFPRSRAARPGITVETGCRARDHGPVQGLVGVDCAFESGMSGGPILERKRDGGWLVVGLIQQSTGADDAVLPAYSMAYRNQMVSVAAFGAAIDRVLRAESARALTKRSDESGVRQSVAPR